MHFVKLTVALIGVALIAGGIALLVVDDSPSDELASCKVLRVVDGDSLIVQIGKERARVRLLGVDAPELNQEEGRPDHYAVESRRFLRNLLIGERVWLKKDRENTDHYGRVLAYVYRAPDRLFVNGELIRQGYARAYDRYKLKHEKTFRQYEQKARAAGRGLWGSTKSEPHND